MRLTPSIQRTGVVITLVVFMFLVAWCALFAYSAVPVSAADALTALWAPNEQVIAHVIVRDIRLPRGARCRFGWRQSGSGRNVDAGADS